MSSTPCKCQICKNNLTELVNRLALERANIKSIQNQLLMHDLDVSALTIQRHLKAYDIESGELERVPEMPDIVETETIPVFQIQDTSLSKWGLSMDDPHGIVRYLQECQVKMYLTQMDITWQQISEFQAGLRKEFPSTAVNNLKKLWDLLDPVTSISLYANQQAAMRTIESMGIEIPKINGFKNVST